MEYTREFRCEVLVPDARICDMRAVTAIVPASDGLMGILAGHMPTVIRLGGGPLTIQEPSGARHEFYLSRGFAQVREGALTILTEECVRADRLDRERVWTELEAAMKVRGRNADETMAQQDRVNELRWKFRMAQKCASGV